MLPFNCCKPKDGVCSLDNLLCAAWLKIYLPAIATYHRSYACQLDSYPSRSKSWEIYLFSSFPLHSEQGSFSMSTFFIFSFLSVLVSSTTVWISALMKNSTLFYEKQKTDFSENGILGTPYTNPYRSRYSRLNMHFPSIAPKQPIRKDSTANSGSQWLCN